MIAAQVLKYRNNGLATKRNGMSPKQLVKAKTRGSGEKKGGITILDDRSKIRIRLMPLEDGTAFMMMDDDQLNKANFIIKTEDKQCSVALGQEKKGGGSDVMSDFK